MSYAIYTTNAIVCGHRPRLSADAAFWLFTKEAGMVLATARSVREERSRQRFALQDFSLINVSLIQGKGGWRIGSVEALDNYFLKSEDKEVRRSLCLVLRTLRRYVQGEEASPDLFAEVETQLRLLQNPDLPNREYVEQLSVVRILEHLGYVPTKFSDKDLLTMAADYSAKNYASLLASIDIAESVSHL